MYATEKKEFFKKIPIMVQNLDANPLMDAIRVFMIEEPPMEEIHAVVNACNDGIAGIMELYENRRYNAGDIVCAMEMMMEIEDIMKPFVKEVFLEDRFKARENAWEQSFLKEILSLVFYSTNGINTTMQ